MRKVSLLFACSVAVPLSGSFSFAYAQTTDNADQRSVEQRSRIHPSYTPKGGAKVPMPAPTNNTSIHADTASKESQTEKVSPPSDTKELVEAVGLCMQAVSPKLDVQTTVLADNGWGYTKPRQSLRGALPYEAVNYYKGNLTISLQDFGRFIDCRTVARIRGAEQVKEVRNELNKEFGVSQINTLPDMEAYVDQTAKMAPDTNFENLQVVGDYLIELTMQTLETKNLNIEAPPTLYLLLISTAPLPPKFQKHNRTTEHK